MSLKRWRKPPRICQAVQNRRQSCFRRLNKEDGYDPRSFDTERIKAYQVGFAGLFLAFSGLESISQLSPVMKTPRKKVGSMALLLVVITIGLTSPLLPCFQLFCCRGMCLQTECFPAQVVSLLAGRWGGIALQTEVAISASALLIFASNTAIIGTYHVFIALSRMQFFPAFLLKRNILRGTPHYSILLATAIPIAVLLLVNGNITILGDMYAVGLLGAFTLTCLGLDIVHHRERKAARTHFHSAYVQPQLGNASAPASKVTDETALSALENPSSQEQTSSDEDIAMSDPLTQDTPPSPYAGGIMLTPWYTFKFSIGLLKLFRASLRTSADA